MPPWPPDDSPRRGIDAAIDRAVHDMMNVDADPAFKARVFARLEQPVRRRIGWPALGLAGGAVAATVVALTMLRTPEPAAIGVPSTPFPPTEIARSQSPAPAPQTPEAPSVRGIGAPGQSGAAPVRPNPKRPVSEPNVTQDLAPGALMATSVDEPSAATDEPSSVAVDALGRIEPIAVEPIGSPTTTLAAIVIAPLTIPEMQIAPLPPRIERD
jgi:hypothetical protein